MHNELLAYVFQEDDIYFGLGAWFIRIREESFIMGMPSLNLFQQRAEYQKLIRQFLARIHHAPSITAISIRHYYRPQDKRMHMALLVRADGSSKAEARRKFEAAGKEIRSAFPHSIFELVAIDDDTLLRTVYQPFPEDDLFMLEVRKSELVVPTKYVAAGDYYYCVEPFDLVDLDLFDALKDVEDLAEPILVNITLMPTFLTDQEIHILNQVMGSLNRFAQGFVAPLLSGDTVFEPDIQASRCLARYEQLAEHADCLFEFRIQIISLDIPDFTTLQAIADTIAPHYGFEVVKPEALQQGVVPYQYLDPRIQWGGSPIWETANAPHSLRRLSYLINLYEAASVVKMPVKFHARKDIYMSKTVNIGGDNRGFINMDRVDRIHIEEWNQGEYSPNDQVATLNHAIQSLIEAVQKSPELSLQARAETQEQLADLQRQIETPKEQRLGSASLRTVMNSLSSTLGAVANLAKIWSTWGPTIQAFLKR